MTRNTPLWTALPAALALLMSMPASAATIDLFGWGFNIDGTTYCSGGGCDNSGQGSLPGSIDTSGFDFDSGLGSISITITGTGAHSMVSFFDHDIDAAQNTFFNEGGSTIGAAAAGQSWEIDEPGFFPPGTPYGDIFDNFQANTLDNSIFDPSGLNEDDVSMAMGWDFLLADGETATIELFLSETLPTTGGLILNQFDFDSGGNIYFSSMLSISGDPPIGVPEPATALLFGLGLIGLAASRRR